MKDIYEGLHLWSEEEAGPLCEMWDLAFKLGQQDNEKKVKEAISKVDDGSMILRVLEEELDL